MDDTSNATMMWKRPLERESSMKFRTPEYRYVHVGSADDGEGEVVGCRVSHRVPHTQITISAVTSNGGQGEIRYYFVLLSRSL